MMARRRREMVLNAESIEKIESFLVLLVMLDEGEDRG